MTTVRRRWIVWLLAAAVVGVIASVAYAGVHFSNNSPPTFGKNSNLSVTGTFSLNGLGNGDIQVRIDASGTGTANCTNRGGNNAPGQNPVAVNLSGIANFSASQITNGGLGPVTATTAAPTVPTPKQAGCPNGGWSVTGLSVTYTSVTLTVFQDASGNDGSFDQSTATQVLQQTFAVSL